MVYPRSELRVRVPVLFMGGLIGHNGDTIKALQAKNDCMIKVSPKDPRGKAELRQVVIMKNVEQAIGATFEVFLNEQKTAEKGTLSRLGMDHEFVFKVDVASNQVETAVEITEVPQINIDSQQCDAGTLLSPNDLTTRSPAQSPIKGQDGLGACSSSNKGSKFSNMLSPLLSPSKDNSCGSSAVTLEAATVATSGGGQQQHYSSTSRLNISGSSSEHSSPRLTKARKISRSSEDVRSGKTQTTPASVASGGLKNVANKFLGVVELDPTTGDLHVRSGGSLQKNLDKTGHVLEEGAVETAAIIEKGVLNPFTKLTKGLGAVLKGHTEITTGAISDNALEPTDVAISTSSPVRSQNNQITNQLLQVKIDEAKSQTNIMLI